MYVIQISPPYSVVFRSKAERIANIWHRMRRVRPDGNCFYRAFLFGILERSLADLSTLRSKLSSLAENCKNAGYDSFAIDDFHEMLQDQLESLSRTPSVETLERETFLDASVDGYMIAFMRCCTGAYLKLHEDDFIGFLPSQYSSMDAFVRNEVDPMYKDCDELQIVALTKTFESSLQVVYLDRSPGDPTIHTFGDPTEGCLKVSMLYKPGHYDLIYG